MRLRSHRCVSIRRMCIWLTSVESLCELKKKSNYFFCFDLGGSDDGLCVLMKICVFASNLIFIKGKNIAQPFLRPNHRKKHRTTIFTSES